MTKTDAKYDLVIIMPVLNEEKYIGQTLEQIYLQDFPMDRLEVVIADGGSTDRTREIVESYRGRFGSLQLLDNPIKRPSSGRNAGVKHSSAKYIVVIDGHVYLPDKNLLTNIVETFERTSADCLCRPQPLTPPDLNEFEQAVALCRGSQLGHKPGSEIFSEHEGEVDPTSSGAMWRRDVFEKIGYFDQQFDACEDVDFNYRVKLAGLKSFLSPKLKVFYYPRSSIRGLWRQMFRYGLGRFRFSRKHNQFSPIQWIAAGGVVGIALLALGSLLYSPTFVLLRMAVAVYLLLIVFFSLGLTVKEKRLSCLLYGILIFPTIHFGLGTGFLFGAAEFAVNREKDKTIAGIF